MERETKMNNIIEVYDIYFNRKDDPLTLIKLSKIKKFKIKHLGKRHFIGRKRPEGFNNAVNMYVVWCGHCKHFTIGYPHGQYGLIRCGKCERDC